MYYLIRVLESYYNLQLIKYFRMQQFILSNHLSEINNCHFILLFFLFSLSKEKSEGDIITML